MLYEQVETLASTHAQCESLSLSNLKEMGMRLEKKTEFADQREKLFDEFSARFKDFKSHQHLFDIFSSPFRTDIDKAPLTFK